MERPSHIIFDTYPQNNASRRLPILGLALGLQAAGLWLFTYGLMSGLIPIVHGPIVLVPIPEKKNRRGRAREAAGAAFEKTGKSDNRSARWTWILGY